MIPVILSGGSGSRLWPVSRVSYPKQFCELLDESLFTKTLKRLMPLGSPWVITTREMKTLTERALKEAGVSQDQALYEPFGKNTAPAVALLCKRLSQLGKAKEVVGIFPADHLIDDEDKFRKIVKAGESYALQGEVVTLGITPTYPATGYGYIETESTLTNAVSGAVRAIGFREKPNEETAREFLGRGNFFWNAGMFIFRVENMIERFEKYSPEVWDVIDRLALDMSNLDEIYRAVRSISIDYAIMERLASHVSLPCDFTWNDLGSWDSMAEVLGAVSAGSKHNVSIESSGNFVFPYGEKTYGFVGVEDLIVVDTADALLVSKRGETEQVKQLVDKLKAAGNAKVTEHKFEIRPWGRFEVLADDPTYKSKLIVIDPGAQISYQMHSKRSESWTIISGSGEVILGDKTLAVSSGMTVGAPAGMKHRIRNIGAEPLRLVEVQTGEYFGEDDIVRYRDDYQRA